MADFATISDLKQNLVRKALTGSLFIAPYSAAAITTATLFETGGGFPAAGLPTGWEDGGILTDEGIRFARSQETDTITGWQYLEPVREDRTSDTETLQADFLETKKLTIELATGADLSSVTYVTGALSIQKPALPTDRYVRLLAVAIDNVDGDEFVAAVHYPRAKVSSWADQAFQKAGGLQWGMTFTAYVDPVLEYSRDTIFGGPGFAALATDMGFSAVT